MANFNMQVTDRGRALQAKAQAGTPLVFTRMRIGSGSLSGQQIADMTGLVDAKMWLTINKSQATGVGKHTVGASLNNSAVTTGFYFRELGVFATDPDLGEILYCYGNAGSGAEYIPATGGSSVVEKQVDVITLIGNAANVSAELDKSLVSPSRKEFEDHQSAKVLDHPDGSVTAAKLANGATTDEKIGDRTISDATAPTGNSGKLTTLFGWIAYMIKAITGKTSWRAAPATTLQATKEHMDDADKHVTKDGTLQTGLNVDTVDGYHLDQDVRKAASPTFNSVSVVSYTSLGDKYAEKYLGQRNTIHSSPHQKMDIEIPFTNWLGYIDIGVQGSWNGRDNSGILIKRFVLTINNPSDINKQATKYIEAGGPVVDSVSIGNMVYDNVKKKIVAKISYRANSDYTELLQVFISGSNVNSGTSAIQNATLSNFYADGEVYERPVISFEDVKFVKTSGAPFSVGSPTVVTNLNANLHNGWNLYSSVSELGLTSNATLDEICLAMPNKSEARLEYTTPGTMKFAPASMSYGIITIVKLTSNRAYAISDSAAPKKQHYAEYANNLFGDWYEVPKADGTRQTNFNAELINGIRIFNSVTTPVGASSGDLWFPPSSSGKRFDGTTWQNIT